MSSSTQVTVKEVLAALERDPRVDMHRYPVQVCVQDDMLVLEGTLENIAAKKVASLIAHRLAGSIPVRNHLRVKAAEKEEDGALRDEVIGSLTQESAFNEYTLRIVRNKGGETVRHGSAEDALIEVEAQQGMVILRGQVGSLSHRRLVEVLTWWTAGCEVVDNHLRIVPAQRDNEDELVDAVCIILEKDPLVHASQVRVSASEGIVTLDGHVSSNEEKMLAVLDAWYVPGVHDVVDRITTSR